MYNHTVTALINIFTGTTIQYYLKPQTLIASTLAICISIDSLLPGGRAFFDQIVQAERYANLIGRLLALNPEPLNPRREGKKNPRP